MIPHCSIFAATAKSNIIVQKKRQHCPELYLLYVVFRVRVILLFVSECLTFSFLFYDCAKIIFRYWSLAVWDSAATLYVDMRFIRPHLSADQDSATSVIKDSRNSAESSVLCIGQNGVFRILTIYELYVLFSVEAEMSGQESLAQKNLTVCISVLRLTVMHSMAGSPGRREFSNISVSWIISQ